MKILIGADPEVFVRHKESKAFVSGVGLVSGTKFAPEPCDLGALQVDGLALEFNINPAHNVEEFVHNITSVYGTLDKRLPPHLELVKEPVAIFGKEYFKGLPSDAKELGCIPDFNAWTGEANPRPEVSDDTPIRMAGGHIHIGWTKDKDPFEEHHFEDCRTIARELDYYLGLPSLYWDADDRRRKMYGCAGAFRPKPYGCEYRVLSNSWLRSIGLMQTVYHQATKAVSMVLAGKNIQDKYGDFPVAQINSNHTNWESDQNNGMNIYNKLGINKLYYQKLSKVVG